VSSLYPQEKAPGHFSLSLSFFFSSFTQKAEDRESIRIKLCDILDP
jgi:hypothetical protein